MTASDDSGSRQDPPTISVSSRPTPRPAGGTGERGGAARPGPGASRPGSQGGPGRARPAPAGAQRNRPPSSSRRIGDPGASPSRQRPPDGPGVLIRPVESARPGTMPAGLVLMVVVIGLVVAMFLNAPATLRKSNGKVDNHPARASIARGVNSVSSFFFLDEPRNALDRALGKNQTTDQDIEEVIAEVAEEEGPTTPDATPVLKVPTPDDPLRIYIAGDSMAGGLADTFVTTSQSTGIVFAEDGHRVSSGLSRPDFFNWPQFLSREIDPQNGWDPDVLIIGFGANDLQNIPIGSGGYVLGTAEWLDEYRKRVAGTMDLVRSGDDDRIVIWLGLPPMGPRSGIAQDVVDQVNHIFATEAESRPWIDYVDTWSYLSNPDGSYAEQLPMESGDVRPVRAGDDIHFDVAGSQRLTWAVMARIAEWADVSAAADGFVAPPGESAPASTVERRELPNPGPRAS